MITGENISLDDVFAHETVREHFQSMYEIGTVNLHESAFAVYGPSMGVSELIMPGEIPDGSNFESGMEHSTSINTGELVRRDPEDIWVDPLDVSSHIDNDGLYDYSSLDDNTKARIERILKSTRGTFEERVEAINSIILHTVSKNYDKASIRNDVQFIAHNHPQYSFKKDSLNSLLYPSGADVKLHTHEAGYQSNILTSAIVGSDGDEHGVLLYRNTPSIQQNPEDYRLDTEYLSNPRKILSILALNGYSYVKLKLDDNGSLHPESRQDLKDFEATTSTKV